MPIAESQLRSIIKSAFPEAQIEITDLVGDQDHYSVKIIDKSFAGKSRIEQHKMVNRALGNDLGTTLHAMQLKTAAS